MAGQKRDPRYDDRLPTVGKRLFAIREIAGLSQDQMAKHLGFSRRQWTSWEYGQVTPSMWCLLELMEKFGIDPAWIIDGPGEIPIKRPDDEQSRRLRRVERDIHKTVKQFGLVLPEGFEPQLVALVMSEPMNAEKSAIRKVHQMLRSMALGE